MGHLKSLPLGAAIMGGFAKGYGDAKGVDFDSLDSFLLYGPAGSSLITTPLLMLSDRSSVLTDLTGNTNSYVSGLIKEILRLDSISTQNIILQNTAKYGILTAGVTLACYAVGYFSGTKS